MVTMSCKINVFEPFFFAMVRLFMLNIQKLSLSSTLSPAAKLKNRLPWLDCFRLMPSQQAPTLPLSIITQKHDKTLQILRGKKKKKVRVHSLKVQ